MYVKRSVRIVQLSGIAGVIGVCAPASAAFVDDSKASVETRNFYMNRDFRQSGAPQSKGEEWAQGFILRMESGYTEGPVGVGIDALGQLGIKLDSSPDRAGVTGLLPQGPVSKRAPDDYSELGLTGKVKVSKTTLKLGTLMPKLPVLVPNESRLLPQTFQGGQLSSLDVENLSFNGGRLTQVSQRNSSNREDMTLMKGPRRNIITGANPFTDQFDFIGADYKWNSALTTGYHYAHLDDLYKQHYLTLTHTLPVTEGQSLKSDLRWSSATDDGNSNVDNRMLGAMFTYSLGAHAFGLSYQDMSGDTGFANVNGTDPYLVNLLQINDFANQDEQSWQARYDFNFAGLGIPGLTFMTRYVKGDEINLGAAPGQGKEWERNTDIGYVIQSGALKNVGLKWRNATYRSSFASDIDENRLIVSYTLALW
ncbi:MULTISPECIES: OprD family porin [unclassified Pseudomonas]|uniref:OprD family porin n=1 Tax=unclassified Pseudomonas TaxID=196821 RepID=UPI00131FDD50|nr:MULTISPECIES: OprD family porin [unclassified Pseudomonas]QHD01002.1 porin [Pseudomonas sp. S04]QHF33486.1 porin [Pseudomonas sp. S19]